MPSALTLTGVRKAFKDVVAVDGIDLDVPQGECFGLLGPNGAGKTTSVEICEGLTRPDAGEVRVLGMDWNRDAVRLRQRLGVQLQEAQMADKLTVLETVQLFRSFYARGLTPDEVIATVELETKRDARIVTLSGGQKQRLALACALVGDPEFLFLDEPTTGLDPQSRRHLWDLIEAFKQEGRTILLTTHYMDEAETLCNRVAIMDGGRFIALGTPAELTASLKAAHIVEVASDATARAFDLEALRGLRGVSGVTGDAHVARLQAEELHSVVPAVLDELERQNVTITRLETHSATLEDVFIALTGRHLRDE